MLGAMRGSSATDETMPLAGAEHARSRVFQDGERVAGRYRIERFIGRGGMGEVYEAHDLELDTRVALKTLSTGGGADTSAGADFRREVLLARRVTHPNICRIFDFGRHGAPDRELAFLTMELLRGEPLTDHIQRAGPMNAEEALPIARQLARALDAAHAAGVVHRDFKSGNVLLVPVPDAPPRAVVTDFGLACEVRRDGVEPADESGIGTPAFVAPEQVTGGPVGPEADLYALGIVLFHMRTGSLPFQAEDPLAMARMRLDTPAPLASEVGVGVDAHWDRAIQRCLALDPRGRFASAAQVVRAIEGEMPAVAPQPSAAEPLATEAPRHRLPGERDAFVGREAELDELGRLLEADAGFVSVIGPGGTGKTRFVTRFARTRLGDWPGGAWFCDLAEARDTEGVVRAVARTLDVPLGRGDAVAQLGHVLAARGRCLVILDNFEQVVESAEPTLGRWVSSARDARFLVTTRAMLGIAGEHGVFLPPLGDEAGIALFVERASAARRDFELAASDHAILGELVRALDGLPLAIELAAARARMLSPRQILERMRDRFRLLADPGRPVGRQATLRAALDWSWDLLEEWERAALAQLSVFEGGFTLADGEAVLDLSPWPGAPWALDVIESLADRSLVRVVEDYRFDLLISIREYAAEKLAELARSTVLAAGGADPVREVELRHGRHYARLGDPAAIEALDGPDGVALRRKLERETGDLVAACGRAVERRDGPVAVATLAAAWAVLQVRGPVAAGAELAARVLSLPDLPVPLRARATRTAGDAFASSGSSDAAEAADVEALRLHRQLGDRDGEGILLRSQAIRHRQSGQVEEARALCAQALMLHRATGNRRREALVECSFAIIDLGRGHVEDARARYEAALDAFRAVGDRRCEGIVLGDLGLTHLELGRLDEARDHFERAIRIHREVGGRRAEAAMLANLAHAELAMAAVHDAGRHGEQALELARAVGDRQLEGAVLGIAGQAAAALGRVDEARERFEAALEASHAVGDEGTEGFALGELGLLDARQGEHRRARERLQAGEAKLRTVEGPLALAKLLCRRIEAEWRAGHRDAVAPLVVEVTALAEEMGAGSGSELGRILVEVRELIAACA